MAHRTLQLRALKAKGLHPMWSAKLGPCLFGSTSSTRPKPYDRGLTKPRRLFYRPFWHLSLTGGCRWLRSIDRTHGSTGRGQSSSVESQRRDRPEVQAVSESNNNLQVVFCVIWNWWSTWYMSLIRSTVKTTEM